MSGKKDDYITKDFFEDSISRFEIKMRKEIKTEIWASEVRIKENMTENIDGLKMDIMQFKDDIISMFIDLKTEIQSLHGLHRTSEDKLDNHSIRIKKLEMQHFKQAPN